LRDLTQGAIWRHLVGMAVFIGAGLIVNTLYMLIDLYFVSRLGKEAVAGVASAGSAMYITMSVAQLVGVGSLALISHAVGRKDQADAQLVFEQALSLGMLIAAIFLVIGYSVGGWAVAQITSDAATAHEARIYLYWYLPALGSMFVNAALGSALRASKRPTTVRSVERKASCSTKKTHGAVPSAVWSGRRPLARPSS